MGPCPRCGEAATPQASFCSACGAALADGPAPRRARKTVTVVFADVSGFTTLAECLDPESLQQVMGRYFAEMRAVVERHGGTVEKFIGDAVMALFGVPRLHEDDALRAARAALDMRAALDGLNEHLALRWDIRLRTHTGINTGEIVLGQMPDGEPLTYGDAVNVAERLQDAAAPGEILLGEVTERLLRDSARLEPIAPLRLKGKGAAVAAWRLEGVRPVPARPGGASHRPLVGRGGELQALRDAFEDIATASRPALVTVLGAAGIGKSRLARALQAEVAGRATVLCGQCLPYGEGVTYRPIEEIVRRAVERPDEASIAELAGDDADGPRVAERIARLVGFATGPVAVEEGHWAVRRMFEIAARRRPLVVLVDDVHWAEPSLLDLLEHVVRFAADVPLLVVCLARPELLDRRPEWRDLGGRSRMLALGPLGGSEAAALLAELTADGTVPAGDRARLLAVAEGNPFFLEQLVAMLAERGSAAQAETPASVQALLAARIDALPPGERAVIDCAAVEGRRFHRTALAELLDAGEVDAVDERLAALERRQLVRPADGVRPDEAGYRFVHGLVREVAYGLLPKSARADLHERYAAWLERRGADAPDELIGFHLEQAHRCHAELRPSAEDERRALGREAGRRLRSAGQSALDRGDLPAGASLLERAAALIPRDDRAYGETLPQLGVALVQLGRLSEADALLDGAAHVARACGDPIAEAHALTARFFARVQVDSASAADELGAGFDAMRETFGAAGDDLGLSRLWRAQGLVYWLAMRAGDAEAAWMRGVAHATTAGDEYGRADSLTWVASAACFGPEPVSTAVPRSEGIVADLHADRYSAALSMRPLAQLHAMAGRFRQARHLLDQSEAMLADLGLSMHSAVVHDEARIAMLEGDPVASEAALRLGYERLEAMGERALLATTATMLAQAVLAQDRDEEASAFADVAEAAAAEDDLHAHMVCRAVRAQLLARRGELADADRLSREAVALAERTDWVVEHGDVLIARAAVLRAAGAADVALVTVRRALDLYQTKGNVVSAERARQLARVAA
jgi:class 3 adenylate cyclase/tetratricopeptide (TPR) repeat protein